MKFFKRLIGFSVGPVIGAVISLVTVPVTTYFISPSEFGKSSMFTIILGFLNVFLYLGMDQSFAREYHEKKDKLSLFFNASIVPILFSLFLLVVLVIFKKWVSSFLFGSDKYQYISFILGLLLFFSVIERFILMNLRMQEKAVEYSLFSVFVKLTVLVTLIFLLVFWKKNFLTVVYSSIFGQIIGDIYLIFRYRSFFREFSFRNLDHVLISKMLIFGFPLLISVSLNSFLNTLGTFSIRKWSTFHELGVFSAGQRIANFLNIIQLSFTSFWVPTAYRWHKQKKDIKNYQLISDMLLLILSIGFFILIFMKKYVIIILSSDYNEAMYIIGFLVLVPILYTLSETTTLGIVFSKKSYLNIAVSVLSVVPCFILNYLLVPKFGNRGASIAVSVAYLFFFVSRSYFSKKTGFSFSLSKQIIVIVLMFITAFANMYSYAYLVYVNVLLFVLVSLMQSGTVKKLIEIVKGSKEYDLD